MSKHPPEWVRRLVERQGYTYQELGRAGGEAANAITDWVIHEGRLYVSTPANGWHRATKKDRVRWARTVEQKEREKQLLLALF